MFVPVGLTNVLPYVEEISRVFSHVTFDISEIKSLSLPVLYVSSVKKFV